jgi:hypothetical protein
MIRFIIGLIVSALLVYFLGGFVPYWGLMAAFFITSFIIGGNIGGAFLSHGLGVSIAWLYLIWSIMQTTASLLPEKIAVLMMVNDPLLLVIANVTLGFFIGGFSGMTGSALNNILFKKELPYGKRMY